MDYSGVVSIVNGLNVTPAQGIFGTSPFRPIKSLPPREKGKVGCDIVAQVCKKEGKIVNQNGVYMNVGNSNVRVKFAMLGKSDTYIFENINLNDPCDYLIFLGLSPTSVHCWVVPYGVATRNCADQHGKADVWVTFNPNKNVPSWLSPYGGDISTATTLIRKL